MKKLSSKHIRNVIPRRQHAFHNNSYTHLLLLVILSCCQYLQVSAQNFQQQKTNFTEVRHLSVEAKRLGFDINTATKQDLLKKYHALQQNGTTFIPALLKVTKQFNPDIFHRLDVQINTAVDNLYSVRIPKDQYTRFIQSPGIEYLELAKTVHSKLDKALSAAQIDAIHQGSMLSQAYTGKDVVVGIIDVGFDYTHPTFTDPETGDLRIKRVWQQNTENSTPPNGFTYGQELATDLSIMGSETDFELSGHGIHVASIATGSGGSLADRYRGVAYDCDVVLVSLLYTEGTGGLNIGVIDGINYIFQYAESLGKPAVVNISQGHHSGPHDGTSLTDQAIDALSGPGRIVVGAVGNEGDPSGFFLHFDHTFDNEQEILSYLVWPDEVSSGLTLIDIWGEEGTDFQIGFDLYNPKTNTREAVGEILNSMTPVFFTSGYLVDDENDSLYYEADMEINSQNNRPHARLFVDNRAQSFGDDVNFADLLDNDFVQIRFTGSQGTIHAYAANNSGEAFFSDLSGIGAAEFVDDVRVQGGNPRSTMGELGGTATSIISVGAYIANNAFQNTGGENVVSDDVIGDQFRSTSRGPTHDGRTKPDIMAPGGLIAAAENSFNGDHNPFVEVDQVDKGNGDQWNYGVRAGTSFAAPIVAGTIALMLQADPKLSPEGAKDVLMMNAEEDNFTGTTPNNTWGYGKLNAFAAMSGLEQFTSVEEVVDSRIHISPNPNNGQFLLQTPFLGAADVTVIDSRGRSVFHKPVHLDSTPIAVRLPEQLNGIYIMSVQQGDQTIQKKLIVID